MTTDAASHQASAKVVLTSAGLVLIALLLWGGWTWYQHQRRTRMEACNRLLDLCTADCAETRRIDFEGLEYEPDARGPLWQQPPANIYEVGCIAGCNKAGLLCSAVFSMNVAPAGGAEE